MAYTGHEGKYPRIPDLHTGLKTVFSSTNCHSLYTHTPTAFVGKWKAVIARSYWPPSVPTRASQLMIILVQIAWNFRCSLWNVNGLWHRVMTQRGALVRFLDSPCEICSGQNTGRIGTGIFPSTPVLPCQYHSTTRPYLSITDTI